MVGNQESMDLSHQSTTGKEGVSQSQPVAVHFKICTTIGWEKENFYAGSYKKEPLESCFRTMRMVNFFEALFLFSHDSSWE